MHMNKCVTKSLQVKLHVRQSFHKRSKCTYLEPPNLRFIYRIVLYPVTYINVIQRVLITLNSKSPQHGFTLFLLSTFLLYYRYCYISYCHAPQWRLCMNHCKSSTKSKSCMTSISLACHKSIFVFFNCYRQVLSRRLRQIYTSDEYIIHLHRLKKKRKKDKRTRQCLALKCPVLGIDFNIICLEYDYFLLASPAKIPSGTTSGKSYESFLPSCLYFKVIFITENLNKATKNLIEIFDESGTKFFQQS